MPTLPTFDRAGDDNTEAKIAWLRERFTSRQDFDRCLLLWADRAEYYGTIISAVGKITPVLITLLTGAQNSPVNTSVATYLSLAQIALSATTALIMAIFMGIKSNYKTARTQAMNLFNDDFFRDTSAATIWPRIAIPAQSVTGRISTIPAAEGVGHASNHLKFFWIRATFKSRSALESTINHLDVTIQECSKVTTIVGFLATQLIIILSSIQFGIFLGAGAGAPTNCKGNQTVSAENNVGNALNYTQLGFNVAFAIVALVAQLIQRTPKRNLELLKKAYGPSFLSNHRAEIDYLPENATETRSPTAP